MSGSGGPAPLGPAAAPLVASPRARQRSAATEHPTTGDFAGLLATASPAGAQVDPPAGEHAKPSPRTQSHRDEVGSPTGARSASRSGSGPAGGRPDPAVGERPVRGASGPHPEKSAVPRPGPNGSGADPATTPTSPHQPLPARGGPPGSVAHHPAAPDPTPGRPGRESAEPRRPGKVEGSHGPPGGHPQHRGRTERSKQPPSVADASRSGARAGVDAAQVAPAPTPGAAGPVPVRNAGERVHTAALDPPRPGRGATEPVGITSAADGDPRVSRTSRTSRAVPASSVLAGRAPDGSARVLPPTARPTAAGSGAAGTGGGPAPAESLSGPVARQLALDLGLPWRGPDGTTRVSLQLQPESLGAVRVTVTVQAEQIRVELHPLTAAGHTAIAAGLPELERWLATQPSGAMVSLHHPGEQQQRPPPDPDPRPADTGAARRADRAEPVPAGLAATESDPGVGRLSLIL